jgi:ATPase subunit of ABC transporter with duplicated ATPase domains
LLRQFKGTLLVVSHDHVFLESLILKDYLRLG